MFRKFYSQEISGEYTHEMCEVGKRAPRITYLRTENIILRAPLD
jgi:hypothetical protein